LVEFNQQTMDELTQKKTQITSTMKSAPYKSGFKKRFENKFTLKTKFSQPRSTFYQDQIPPVIGKAKIPSERMPT